MNLIFNRGVYFKFCYLSTPTTTLGRLILCGFRAIHKISHRNQNQVTADAFLLVMITAAEAAAAATTIAARPSCYGA
jgi:hypothetical protein